MSPRQKYVEAVTIARLLYRASDDTVMHSQMQKASDSVDSFLELSKQTLESIDGGNILCPVTLESDDAKRPLRFCFAYVRRQCIGTGWREKSPVPIFS